MDKSDDNKGNFDWKDNTIEWKDIIKKEARGYEKEMTLAKYKISERNLWLPKEAE